MIYIWFLIQILIGYNLLTPTFLAICYFLSSKRKYQSIVNHKNDYAIIVTAYQQTSLLPSVVQSLLKLNYNNYLIYIVADNCDITNLNFDDPKVILLKPPSVLASNTRSHLYAIANFKRDHEILTIIDSDNLTDPEYLNELNTCFAQGFEAVQGIRKAKNLNTNYACMDAARDIYYHFYDGEVLFKLGSSATLAGSGMAFKTALYKTCFENYDLTGAGFDKVLQAKILLLGKRIAFAPRAIVFDEKTTNANQLVNQRSRWINTWFKYSIFGFHIILKGLTRMDINQLLFGLIVVRPPLFMFILLSVLCLIINLFISPVFAVIWVIAFIMFMIGFYIPLRFYKADPRIYNSLVNIPKFIYFQLVSLFYAKNANKRSIATKHQIKQ